MGGRVLETRKLVESMARRIRYTVQLNILQGRDPDGNPYKPLVRPIRKKLRKNDPRPLIDTGALVNSFVVQVESDTRAIVGDPTEYGIFQNFGTSHVPSREFMGIRPEDRAEMETLVTGWTAWVAAVHDADWSQQLLDFNNA